MHSEIKIDRLLDKICFQGLITGDMTYTDLVGSTRLGEGRDSLLGIWL